MSIICLHLTTPHFLGTIAIDTPGERGERTASRRAAMRPAIEFWFYTLASQLRSIPASRPGTDHFGLMKNALIFSVKRGMPALEQVFPEHYGPVLAWKKVIRSRLKWLVSEFYRPPLTLCHGDVHLDNIFFDDSFPGGLKMIGAPRRVRRCSTEPG